jgi:hypothetical protein
MWGMPSEVSKGMQRRLKDFTLVILRFTMAVSNKVQHPSVNHYIITVNRYIFTVTLSSPSRHSSFAQHLSSFYKHLFLNLNLSLFANLCSLLVYNLRYKEFSRSWYQTWKWWWFVYLHNSLLSYTEWVQDRRGHGGLRRRIEERGRHDVHFGDFCNRNYMTPFWTFSI